MADDIKYEHKTVRTLRGTDGLMISKMQKDGWEFVDKTNRNFRSSLNFRRPKRPIPWTRVGAVAAGAALLAAIIAVGALHEGSHEKSASDEPTTQVRDSESASPRPAETPAPNLHLAKIGTPKNPITAQNSEPFAALLAGPTQGKAVGAFADKYILKEVEFDGHIALIYNREYDSTDVIIRAGTRSKPTGPRFALGESPIPGRATFLEELKKGQKVHVNATLGAYEHDDSQDTFTNETDLMLLNLVGKVVPSERN